MPEDKTTNLKSVFEAPIAQLPLSQPTGGADTAAASAGGGGGAEITVHPLVLLSLSDHFTAVRAGPYTSVCAAILAGSRFGVLMGTRKQRVVDICSTFELWFPPGGGASSSTSTHKPTGIDIEAAVQRRDMTKAIYPSQDVVGWYIILNNNPRDGNSNGTLSEAAFNLVQEAVKAIFEVDSPVVIVVDVQQVRQAQARAGGGSSSSSAANPTTNNSNSLFPISVLETPSNDFWTKNPRLAEIASKGLVVQAPNEASVYKAKKVAFTFASTESERIGTDTLFRLDSTGGSTGRDTRTKAAAAPTATTSSMLAKARARASAAANSGGAAAAAPTAPAEGSSSPSAYYQDKDYDSNVALALSGGVSGGRTLGPLAERLANSVDLLASCVATVKKYVEGVHDGTITGDAIDFDLLRTIKSVVQSLPCGAAYSKHNNNNHGQPGTALSTEVGSARNRDTIESLLLAYTAVVQKTAVNMSQLQHTTGAMVKYQHAIDEARKRDMIQAAARKKKAAQQAAGGGGAGGGLLSAVGSRLESYFGGGGGVGMYDDDDDGYNMYRGEGVDGDGDFGY